MVGDLEGLYHNKVRSWARKVRYDRRIVSPSITVTERGAVCGSRVTMDFVYSEKVVSAIGWTVRSCILGMASTACLAEIGQQNDIFCIIDAGRKLELLLKGSEPEFDGEWNELEMFRSATGFPSRHTAILLPFKIAEMSWNELSAGGIVNQANKTIDT